MENFKTPSDSLMTVHKVPNFKAVCPIHGEYTIGLASLVLGCLHPLVRENVCPHPDCQKAYEDRRKTKGVPYEVKEREERERQALKASGIPTVYIGKTIRELDPSRARDQVVTYVKNAQALTKAGKGLVLYGDCGTGKTHTACAIIQAVIPEIWSRYETVSGLIEKVKSAMNRDDTSTTEVIQNVVNAPFLVIDEIGAQVGTEYEKNLIGNILIDRDARHRPTILISNLPPDHESAPSIRTFIGDRAFDRLIGNSVFLKFEGKSHRREATTVAEMLEQIGGER